jgi:hypothetical protein
MLPDRRSCAREASLGVSDPTFRKAPVRPPGLWRQPRWRAVAALQRRSELRRRRPAGLVDIREADLPHRVPTATPSWSPKSRRRLRVPGRLLWKLTVASRPYRLARTIDSPSSTCHEGQHESDDHLSTVPHPGARGDARERLSVPLRVRGLR